MDSIDTVELLMLLEEVFETDIPEGLVRSDDIVNWLELRLSNRRPNMEAAALLKKLAKAQQRADLTQRLEGTWRQEQIAAIINQVLRNS